MASSTQSSGVMPLRANYIRYTEYEINPLFKGSAAVQEYEIEFYDKADGSEPAKEFILSLDKKMQAKVLRVRAKTPVLVPAGSHEEPPVSLLIT